MIFNRNDPKVREDMTNLSEQDFIDKYKEVTSETVLKVVWKSGNKLKSAVPLPQPKVIHQKKYSTDDQTEVTIKKHDSGSTVIETEDNSPKAKAGPKPGQKLDNNATTVTADKPGRTPRMRELIAELGKDKAQVKAALDAEGFNTAGSGFHSEWNRVSKAIK